MLNGEQIISLMGEIAPKRLAEDWDNVGLQIGDSRQNVENVLLTLDVTMAVVEEAIERDCQMIISHHPVIFNGLKAIHNGNQTGRMVMKAIKNDLLIYTAHTNLDITAGGLNDYLAGMLGLDEINTLHKTDYNKIYKFVVFVPEDNAEELAQIIFSNGGGKLGDYSHTSFVTPGEGTFKPLAGANPQIGNKYVLNHISEKRIETIVPEDKLKNVIRAVELKHPYEEVAYDIYPILKQGSSRGLGRIGRLQQSVVLKNYIELIKDRLDLPVLKYIGNLQKKIKKVALCTGSGSEFIDDAYFAGADLYLTGDIKYHDAQHAEEKGLAVLDIGHYASEVIVKDLLKNKLTSLSEKKLKENVNFIKSGVITNPWHYY